MQGCTSITWAFGEQSSAALAVCRCFPSRAGSSSGFTWWALAAVGPFCAWCDAAPGSGKCRDVLQNPDVDRVVNCTCFCLLIESRNVPGGPFYINKQSLLWEAPQPLAAEASGSFPACYGKDAVPACRGAPHPPNAVFPGLRCCRQPALQQRDWDSVGTAGFLLPSSLNWKKPGWGGELQGEADFCARLSLMQ